MLLNKEAIPAAKRPNLILNVLADKPNDRTIDDPANPGTQIPEFTDWEWINELAWVYLKTRNERGHRIRAEQAAEPAEDIRT